MGLKGIIFDLDGTLANSIPFSISIFSRVFEKYTGKQVPDDMILAMFGPNEAGVIRQVIPDYKEPYQAYLQLYRDEHDDRVTMIPGLQALLNQVKSAGLKTAVITGKGEVTARFTLDRLDLLAYFDTLKFGSIEPKADKTESIAELVVQWGFDPDEVAYVGDSPSDIHNAISAGVIPVAVRWDNSQQYFRDESPRTDLFFSSTGEMLDWLKKQELAGALS